MSTQRRTRGSVRIRKGAGHSAGRSASKKFKLAVASQGLRIGKTFQGAKMAAARQIANAATAGFLGIEKKFLDSAKAEAVISTAAAMTGGEVDPSAGCTGCLSCPAQGDTEQSRDGKRLVIDSLILKGAVFSEANAAAAAFDAYKVFVAVILDTQTNGVQLDSESVFKNLLATTDGVVCPTKNLLFGNRFRILKSQVYDVTPVGVVPGAGATVTYCGVRRDFDWYIPFKGGLPVNLNAGTTADVANVIDNSIHVLAFTTGVTKITYNARIRFQG